MRKPCCDKQDTNKGAWSKHEDQKLVDYIRTNGEGSWRSIPQASGSTKTLHHPCMHALDRNNCHQTLLSGLLRCGKNCRVRRVKYLNPEVKRGNFAEDEEDLIIRLHALLGNRWSLIAGRLPGRTDKEVQNYWNSHLRLKLVSMGIDPNNHRLSNRSGITTAKLNSKEDQHLGTTRDNTCMQPNLNLDLNISLLSPPCAVIEQRMESGELRPEAIVETTTLPTLLLFR